MGRVVWVSDVRKTPNSRRHLTQAPRCTDPRPLFFDHPPQGLRILEGVSVERIVEIN